MIEPEVDGSNESFNGTFRRECLDAESFRHELEAQVVIESWRRRYNQERPNSTLGYQTPASVYWGNGRNRSSSEARSGPAPKKSTRIFDHKATIGERPDSEVGGTSSNMGTRTKPDHSENLTFEVAKKGGSSKEQGFMTVLMGKRL